jgi:hypothetical protein
MITRRKLLQFLGLGGAAAVVAPEVARALPAPVEPVAPAPPPKTFSIPYITYEERVRRGEVPPFDMLTERTAEGVGRSTINVRTLVADERAGDRIREALERPHRDDFAFSPFPRHGWGTGGHCAGLVVRVREGDEKRSGHGQAMPGVGALAVCLEHSGDCFWSYSALSEGGTRVRMGARFSAYAFGEPVGMIANRDAHLLMAGEPVLLRALAWPKVTT